MTAEIIKPHDDQTESKPEVPTIRVTPREEADRGIELRPVTEQELTDSGLWQDPEAIPTEFLSDEDLEDLASPKSTMEALTSDNQEKIAWGIYAQLGEEALKLVGIAGLHNLHKAMPGTSTFILDPDARGRGIGTLAKHGTTTYAFDHLGKDRITSRTREVNEPSKRSLSKAGFERQPLRPSSKDSNNEQEWTSWMAFKPGDREFMPGFGGLEPGQIEASRKRIAEMQHKIDVDVVKPTDTASK